MYKEILEGKPGTPGQKAIRFKIESIEPHGVALIAIDPEKLEEYVEALRVERLSWDVIAKLVEIHDRELPRNPELHKYT
jgi:aryl-alcohol dehydrogenase-like predicted oxidoreductase